MEIEIKVMWCKGLTSFNFFQKLTIYTLVSIKPENNTLNLTQEQKQEQKTPVDEEGDGDPEWNHTVTFDLRRLEALSPGFENLSVGFEFRHRGQLFGDKTVGEVNVPLISLVQSVGFGVVRFVSYEVRSPEGKHNGILDFSYKLVAKHRDDDDCGVNVGLNSQISIHGYHSPSDPNNNNTPRLDWDYQNNSEPNNNNTPRLDWDYQNNSEGHAQIISHHHQQHYQLNQHSSSSQVGRIEYPRIDLDDWTASSSTALVTTDISHYPPHPPPPPPPPSVVYPPPLQCQWCPPPHQPPHYPPPPPPPPVLYPPRAYGDPHWGYYRPPGYNNQPNW